MSSSLGPKIYLRGVKLHILTYGGLGHRPLLCEKLMLVGVLKWSSIAYLDILMENISTLGYLTCLHYASMDVKYHLQFKI